MANLLVADREISTRISLKTHLYSLGHSIIGYAHNTKDMLDQIERLPVDLVLMDVNLPGEFSGITAGRRIEQHTNTPVIYLLSRNMEIHSHQDSDSLLGGFLRRPFTSKELSNAILYSLNRSKLESLLSRSVKRQKEDLKRQRCISEFLSRMNSEFDSFTCMEENLTYLRKKLDLERIALLKFGNETSIDVLYDNRRPDQQCPHDCLPIFLENTSASDARELSNPIYLDPALPHQCCYLCYLAPLNVYDHPYGLIAFVYRKEMIRKTNLRSLLDVVILAIKTTLERHQSILKIRKLEQESAERDRQLMRSERLAGMGRMMTAIGHELNQPLQSIKLLADSVLFWEAEQKRLPYHQVLENMSKISERVVYSNRIIKNMMQMIKGSDRIDARGLDLNEIVARTLEFYHEKIRKHDIILLIKQEKEIGTIQGSEVHIQQIIVNLVNNAISALDTVDRQGKRIIVATGEEEDRIILSIADNGPGIEEKKKEMIFNPFYSENDNKENLGMGLYVVFNFIKSHGADLKVLDREEDTGVEFRITFSKAESYEDSGNR